ncbi:50S ribosomal protein L4, partial [Bacillus cereus]
VTTANSASVLDIFSADKLLVVQSALTQIEEVLA